MKKISIIVPIYNTEKYLQRCIESLINQTYQNLEIILVNDGSTDNSEKICAKYKKTDNRIKVFSKVNGGQSSARNLALENITGDYIGFVDSDDWIALDTYEYLMNIIEKNSADIAFIERIKTNGKELKKYNKRPKEVLYENDNILEEYLRYGMKTGNYGLPNYLYNSKLFRNIRFPEGKICEDIVTNYKLMKEAKKLIKSNKICYYYFQDNYSTTRNKFSDKDFDLIYACDELIRLSINENKKIKKMVKEKRDRCDFSLLAKIAYYGVEENEKDYKEEIEIMMRNIRKNYFELIKTNMNFIRKIQLSLFAINYNLIIKIRKYIN